ncbi:MAG TPA: methyltransferase domain-containing protein [Thermoguttaceae bacterium]|nr:methyltransferase domain-containing protein [Thermoguttaceae bacterium]
MATSLEQMYDLKYSHEEWHPLTLRPHALSTNRYDDVARLLCGEATDGKCLDVGCGSGQLLLALASQFDEATGIDLSSNRIARAQCALHDHYPELVGKVRFVHVDGEESLPFADGEFDVLIMCAIVEHVVNLYGLMDEAARVCRRGGCLLITVPNICYLRHVKDLLMGRVPMTGTPNRDVRAWRHHGWDGGHFHYFSKASLTDLLRQVGFEPERWTGDGR